ncbi:MAG: Vitamin B12 dependent methionine synthase activation subunit [Clostridia bacterium]|nr:Vitamin B12 dependent methionine synthase activation subunit [Clostridia bacterium]
MMVYTKTYDAPPIDRREIMRYAGVRGDAPEIEAILDECLKESENKLTYKLCYGEFPVSFFVSVDSKDLKKHLEGCDKVILFAATVGIGIDRLISRYASISPTKSLLFQAIGAERIEALCDEFNSEFVGSRFSPGYGDLPLEFQKEIFRLLDCPKRIGLTLNESMLMSPTKSVTAIIGVK